MSQEALITSLGSAIFDSLIADTVAVYDSNYSQVFRKARPLKVEVNEDSKIFQHPLEDGTEIFDHRIVLPIEIELSLILTSFDYQNVYEEIKQIFIDADLLIISTRSATYENQIIQSMPHTETSDVYNGLIMTLKTKQADFVTSETSVAPVLSSDSSTTDKGLIQGETLSDEAGEAGEEQSTFLKRWFGAS